MFVFSCNRFLHMVFYSFEQWRYSWKGIQKAHQETQSSRPSCARDIYVPCTSPPLHLLCGMSSCVTCVMCVSHITHTYTHIYTCIHTHTHIHTYTHMICNIMGVFPTHTGFTTSFHSNGHHILSALQC